MHTIINFYRDAFRGLPKDVWFLSFVLFVNRCGTMVLTFLVLYLTQELGFSLAVAGRVLSVYGLGHMVGAWIGGWFCDRLGFLRIQFLSLAFSGLGFLVMEHMQTLPSLLAITFFVATSAEAFRPANSAALAALSPPHLRTRAVALNRMALNLGWGVGPAVGGWLASHDYALLFRVDGVSCMIAALVLHVLFRGRTGTEVDTDAEESTSAVLLHPLRDLPFLSFLLLLSLFALIFFQGWGTLTYHLKEVYGFSETRFGMLMALNALLIFVFEMVLTHWAERFRPLLLIGIGAFLVGAGLAILPLGTSVALAVLSMVTWTFGEMLAVPFAGGWVANRAGAKYRGKYMGIYTMGWGAAFIAAPALGTWVYQELGADTLWFGCGVMGILIWMGCWLLGRVLAQPGDGITGGGVVEVAALSEEVV
jgi:MFS family permease